MTRISKILDEARADVAVVSAPVPPQQLRQRGRQVEVAASLHMRREVLRQMAPQYREASSAHKGVVLADFVRLTGYHRTYARWLLNHAQEEHSTVKRPSHCVYGAQVEEALVQVWEQTNRMCSKRLIPFLPTAIAAMERHDRLHLMPECRRQLLCMSAATADRLLLKSTIPIRTFEQ